MAASNANEPNPRRIMLVDDDFSSLKLMGLMLERFGGFAIEARNRGDWALQYLEITEALPDVIISDDNMPGMDGIRLVEKVRANPKLQHLPFIMTTTRSLPADILRMLNAGADDYITKPFLHYELVAVVNRQLPTRQPQYTSLPRNCLVSQKALAETSLMQYQTNRYRFAALDFNSTYKWVNDATTRPPEVLMFTDDEEEIIGIQRDTHWSSTPLIAVVNAHVDAEKHDRLRALGVRAVTIDHQEAVEAALAQVLGE
jgi:two-component system, chemotaxis family, chemotaxis protein CheY